MQAPIKPRWLLRQADELGGRNAGPGRPRSADLRRSVSASYFAVFHALARGVAAHLLPRGTVEHRLTLTRAVRHDAIDRVCGWVGSGGTPRPHSVLVVAALRSEPHIVAVARAVSELQVARHEADYDHAAELNRSGTLLLADRARAAVDTIEATRDTPAFQAFLALVALST